MHVYIFMRNNNAHKADQEHGRRDRDGVSHLAGREAAMQKSVWRAGKLALLSGGRPATYVGRLMQLVCFSLAVRTVAPASRRRAQLQLGCLSPPADVVALAGSKWPPT